MPAIPETRRNVRLTVNNADIHPERRLRVVFRIKPEPLRLAVTANVKAVNEHMDTSPDFKSFQD